MELKFRKLMADEIDVRAGRVIDGKKQGALLLLYKDARCDMDLLDETVGAMNWQRKHSRDNANCAVGIYDSDKQEWIWKEDTGTESNAEAAKGLASDSFKRACTNWGIGRELYTAKNIFVPCELKDGKLPKFLSWSVKEIGYNERGEIETLVICDNNGKIVYSKNAAKNTPNLHKSEEVDKQTDNVEETKQDENSESKEDFRSVFEEVQNEDLTNAENVEIVYKNGTKERVGNLPIVWLRTLANKTEEEYKEAREAAKTILKLKYNESV